MSQRRTATVLKLVVSKPNTEKSSPRQRKLPIGFSTSPPSTVSDLEAKLERLAKLRPAYVEAVARLVDNALDELEGRRP